MFLIVLIGVSNLLQAQMSDSLLRYYTYINAAELAICDSNYNEAEKLYNLGFKYKKNPFSIDVYNLSLVCAIQKNYKMVYVHLKTLADLSCPVSEYENETIFKIFKGFYKSKYGKRMIKYAKKPTFSYNVDLRAKYDSLRIIDQYFRKKPGSYKLYSDTIYKIDTSNVNLMMSLIDKYGFPSEDLVGTNFGFSYRPFDIIIRHNHPNTNKPITYNFHDILLKATLSGAINNGKGASLIELNAGYSYYGIMSFGTIYHYRISPIEFYIPKPDEGVYGYYSIKDEDKELIQDLNKKRKEIGLPTIEEKRKAFRLPLNTPFNLHDGEMVGFDLTKEQYKDVVEKIIQIKYQ